MNGPTVLEPSTEITGSSPEPQADATPAAASTIAISPNRIRIPVTRSHCARWPTLGEGAADLEPAGRRAPGLDRPARLRDDVLHDREAESRTARCSCSIRAIETLEETRQ